jgi:hypothetical protein
MWITRRLLPITFLIVVLIYGILVAAFFVYERRTKEDTLLRQRTINACLGSRGHIGPGFSCWYDKPTPTQPVPLN